MSIDSSVTELAVPPTPLGRRWGGWLTAGWVAALVALVAGVLVFNSWHHNRVPFGPAAIEPQLVGLQVITPTSTLAPNVERALRTLGAAKGNSVQIIQSRNRRQYVVGRIDVRAHSAPDGSQYVLVVLDNRTHTVVRDIQGEPESDPNGPGSGSGWDYGINNFASKYSWLSPLKELGNSSSGYHDPGSAVIFTPGPATQLPFSAVLRADALPVTNVHRDLTIALLMLGPDRQPYWAQRLN
jgi:hypothetical protein